MAITTKGGVKLRSSSWLFKHWLMAPGSPKTWRLRNQVLCKTRFPGTRSSHNEKWFKWNLAWTVTHQWCLIFRLSWNSQTRHGHKMNHFDAIKPELADIWDESTTEDSSSASRDPPSLSAEWMASQVDLVLISQVTILSHRTSHQPIGNESFSVRSEHDLL